MISVTEEQIDAYERDGVVCFKGLLSPEEVMILQDGIELNLRSLSQRAKIVSKSDDPGHFIEDFCNWESNPFYRRFLFESPIAMVAGKLMRSSISRLYHDHLLVKEAGTRQRTPWHQDQPYYNIDGKQNCSFWIPVDAISRNSTLELITGSHLGPWLMPRTFVDNQAKWFPEGSLLELPDIESQRDSYPIVGWEMTPGDVICFHMLTIHAAAGVADSDGRRRVFSVRFLGDDIVHAPRSWATSPEFPGVRDLLPAGVPMDHPLFPVLWKASNSDSSIIY